ncbi:MAG: hypothetical protein WD875_09760 [Pirellulales bacterium]
MSKTLARIATLAALATFATPFAFAENAADDAAKVSYRDDFEKGADNWEPMDKSIWTLRQNDQGYVFSQHKKTSKYKPPVRSPVNIALLKGNDVGDFTLTAKVLSTHEDYGHRDAVLVFGYQDASHFYYVHLGKQTDDHANQIFIVNGEPRTKISTKTSKGTPWDEKWHNVKIVRRAADGAIEVYFDDMKTPVMTASDKTFAHGRIGIGTFDDTSDWDDIVLEGTAAK